MPDICLWISERSFIFVHETDGFLRFFLWLEVIAGKMFLSVEYSTVENVFQTIKHLNKQINELKTGDISQQEPQQR